MRTRRAPAWLWPALISATLALLAFFLVMIIVPGLSDSYISGSARPALQTDVLTEPLVTRLQTEATRTPTEPTAAPAHTTGTDPQESQTAGVAETAPAITDAAEMTVTSNQSDRFAGAATLLIRRAIDRARASIVTLYASMPERGEQPGRSAMFSGVIVAADGYLVTPTSNLSFALTYNGRLHPQAIVLAYLDKQTQPYRVEAIAHDRNTDVAILRIVDSPALKPIEMVEEPSLELGDMLVVLGGSELDMQDLSLSVGYLTGMQRRSFFENGLENGMIQTSAFVTPIMSGAALLDPGGRMVGLINSNVSRSYSDLHGYALPTDVLRGVIEGLRETSPPPLIRRVWLGIRAMDEAEYEELADARDYPSGLMITEVLENGPAASSDMLPFDVIISVDGENVRSMDQLNRVLENRLVGERVMITLYRTETGRYVNIYVYLREPEA